MYQIFCIFVLIKLCVAEFKCPSLCVCKNSRMGENSTNLDYVDWLKLRCGGPENPISELKEIDLSRVNNMVINLNLSGNVISTLTRELHLPVIQKLDLSHNQITLIESDTFYNLSSLQRLDLSHNQINAVSKELFKGLISLERLLLSHNRITTVIAGTFDYLIGLKQLDLNENPLKCECGLIWLTDWLRDKDVKLIGNPKCDSPNQYKGEALRRLRAVIDLTECTHLIKLNTLIVKPSVGQVVFTGDTITLTCRAPFTKIDSNYRLNWIYPNAVDNTTIEVTSVDLKEEGLAESTVIVKKINMSHSGEWSCNYSKETGSIASHQLELIVISNQTSYCPYDESENNRGVLMWPQTIVNRTVEIRCGSKPHQIATRYCNSNATWSDLNTNACPYVSEFTKMLQEFSRANISWAMSAHSGARSLCESLLTALNKNMLHDPDDVMYIHNVLNNFTEHAQKDPQLATILLEIVKRVMTTDSEVLLAAETQYNSCSRLVKLVETLATYGATNKGENGVFPIHVVSLRGRFLGASCLFPAPPALPACHRPAKAPQMRADARATLQIPSSLFHNLPQQERGSDATKKYNLIISMYDNASLFPALPRMDDGFQRGFRLKDFYGRSTKRDDMSWQIVSPVIGVTLENVTSESRLAEPLYITLKADTDMWGGPGARAALYTHKLATWTNDTPDCAVWDRVSNMVVIRCYRLGYIGLLRNVETGFYGGHTSGARFKISHPAIYVGSIVLLPCLAAVAITYVVFYSRIDMNSCDKHILVNTCIAFGALCIVYTLGVYQTEDANLCRILGLLMHFLMLASLLWQAVPAAKASPPVLYALSWGVALAASAASAALGMSDYAGYERCWPCSPAAIAGVAASALLAAGAQCAERRGAAVLAAFTCTSAAGAASVSPSLPYQEDVCSILYALAASVLGTFILFFYGCSREDVREQWRTLSWRYAKRIPNTHPPLGPIRATPERDRKAAIALDPRIEVINTNTEISETVDLMMMHKRQYRSNDSSAGEEPRPETFYNPNQIDVARKFFRRQRKNVETNISDLPTSHRISEDDLESRVSDEPIMTAEPRNLVQEQATLRSSAVLVNVQKNCMTNYSTPPKETIKERINEPYFSDSSQSSSDSHRVSEVSIRSHGFYPEERAYVNVSCPDTLDDIYARITTTHTAL